MTRPERDDVDLHPLDPGDLERVLELEDELFGAGAWSRETYESELAAPGRRYLKVVAPDGRLVGYGGIALEIDAEIMTIGVAPQWRGRGLGSLLLDALLDAARGSRARRVFLEVRAGDDGAQRLYRRAGFRPIGIRRGYYQPENEDAVVMRLDLALPHPVGAEAVGRSPGRR